jgi:hypothetical protein
VSAGSSEPGSVPGPKVFITYRREETAPHAGRLYDAMVARFGEGNVFMDVDMAPGVDFVERITEAVAACHVLIVVMGPRWATVEDEEGTARLADPEDFVRLEVETALRRADVTPIPVLVAGARMPNRRDLPQELRPLTRRNALELSEGRWRSDVGRLITTLDELLAETRPGPGLPSQERGIDTEKTAPADAAEAPAKTAPRLTVAARTPLETKPAALWTRVGRRTRWALLGAIALAAIVVVVVVAAGGGGGGSGGEGAASSSSSDPDYQELLKDIPARIRPGCSNGKDVVGSDQTWMITDFQALAQAECGLNPYLTYGLWQNPSSAQAAVLNAGSDFDACPTSTTNAMKTILPHATRECGVDRTGDFPGIYMWWNENGSRVAGWFSWHTQNQGDALKQWQKVAQAPS